MIHILETSVAFCQAIQNTSSFGNRNVHSDVAKLSQKTTELRGSNEVDIAVVIGELKSFILLVLEVLLATRIPEYFGWTHPGLLISETD